MRGPLGDANHDPIPYGVRRTHLGQCAHSVEEYIGRLWESFPPARFVSGLVSEDLERGFLLLNLALVAFGLWCWLWPVRRGWPVALPLAWAWVAIEIINGIGHSLGHCARGRTHQEWRPRRFC